MFYIQTHRPTHPAPTQGRLRGLCEMRGIRGDFNTGGRGVLIQGVGEFEDTYGLGGSKSLALARALRARLQNTPRFQNGICDLSSNGFIR